MPININRDLYKKNFQNSLGSLFLEFYSKEELNYLEEELWNKYNSFKGDKVEFLFYKPGDSDPLLRRQHIILIIGCNSLPFFASRLRKVFQLLKIDISRSLHFHPQPGRELYYLETSDDNYRFIEKLTEGIESAYNRILKLTEDFRIYYKQWEETNQNWDPEIKDLQKWLLDKSFVWEGAIRIFQGNKEEYGYTELDEGIEEWFLSIHPKNPETYSNASSTGKGVIDAKDSNLRSFLGDEKYFYIAFVKEDEKLLYIGSLNQFAKASALVDIPFFNTKFLEFMNQEGIEPFSGLGRTTRMMFNYIPTEIIFLFPASNYVKLHSANLEQSLRNSLRSIGVLIRKNKGLIISFIPESNWSEITYEKSDSIISELFPNASIRRYFVMRGNMVEAFHLIHYPNITSPKLFDAASRVEFSFRSWMDLLEIRYLEVFKTPIPEDTFFHEDYKATHTPDMCVYDLKLTEEMGEQEISVAITNRTDTTIIYATTPKMKFVLSQWVKVLSDMGLNPITQRVYHFEYKGKVIAKSEFFFHFIENKKGLYHRIQKLIYNTLLGKIKSDSLSELVLWTDLDENGIYFAKAIRDYCLQTDARFNPEEFNSILVNHSNLVKVAWEYFTSVFRDGKNPDPINLKLEADKGKTIREDAVMHAFATAVLSILRTNFFGIQNDPRVGMERGWISFKIDSSIPSSLPNPRPYRETFVYSPNFQGIHLRGGAVARGGIRWSDRLTDYRTELLGLLKTQMVKNAIIVPVGSKGSFILTPNALLNIDIPMVEAYKGYISGLLELVDNRKKGQLIPYSPGEGKIPIALDEPDPYLVVAADKGTAQLSDTANSLSEKYNFWLGDAFASGGSRGYSHKKYGITAKGALITADRNLRLVGIDFRKEPTTVVGIGDMGGDVFGNGLLESEYFLLVAAFNHKHIFIDPNPNPKQSYEERKRLFYSENSGWDYYDLKLISKGGGVWERTEKSIPVSPEAAKVLGIQPGNLSGIELIQAILKAPVDLLYNGGIGTYVKCSEEENSKVGDPANNDVRVDGKDLRCKVVSEGGNLGFTQKGRIEYDQNGGYIFTDAIDNSGGVDLSDHEVNIKIFFNELIEKGQIASLEERDKFLMKIDREVVDSVLINNQLQSLAINVDRFELEKKGNPTPRPILAVQLAELKMKLYELCLDAGVFTPEDWERLYLGYFPPTLRNQFQKELFHHPLGKEITTTRAVNFLVNLMGVSLNEILPEDKPIAIEFITGLMRELYKYNMDEILDQFSLIRDKEKEKDVMETIVYIRESIREKYRPKKHFNSTWIEFWKGKIPEENIKSLESFFLN